MIPPPVAVPPTAALRASVGGQVTLPATAQE